MLVARGRLQKRGLCGLRASLVRNALQNASTPRLPRRRDNDSVSVGENSLALGAIP